MWPSEARRFWHAGICAVAAALLAGCGGSGDDDGRVVAGDSGAGGHGPGGQSQSGGAPSQGGSSGGAGAGAASGSGASTAAGAGASAGAGGAIVTTDDAWKRYSAALCHHYFQCANELFFSEEMEAMVDEAGCAAWLGRSLAANPHLAALDAAVAGGVLQVDGAALDRCVAAIALCNYPIDLEPTAGFAFEALTPCREVFEGTVPAGGDCTASEECAGDSSCVTPEATEVRCSGRCEARLAAGEACSSDRQCGAPDEAGWAVCEAGRCAAVTVSAPAAVGAACGRPSAALVEPCVEGAWCPLGADRESTCAPLVGIGEDCAPDSSPFTQCAQGHCVEGTCEAFRILRSEGESCDGALCDSFSSLACQDGRCVKADGSAGSPCSHAAWYQLVNCAPAARGAVGDSCSSHADCESGLCEREHGCVAALCSAR